MACPLYRWFVTTALALTVGFDCAVQWKPLGTQRQTSFSYVLLKDFSPSRVNTLAETTIRAVKCVSLNLGPPLSRTCFPLSVSTLFYTARHDNRSRASAAYQGVSPFPSHSARSQHPFSRTQILLPHLSLTQSSQAETTRRCRPFLTNPLRGTAAGPPPQHHCNPAELAAIAAPHRAADCPDPSRDEPRP